jgi:hypothetical protein
MVRINFNGYLDPAAVPNFRTRGGSRSASSRSDQEIRALLRRLVHPHGAKIEVVDLMGEFSLCTHSHN